MEHGGGEEVEATVELRCNNSTGLWEAPLAEGARSAGTEDGGVEVRRVLVERRPVSCIGEGDGGEA